MPEPTGACEPASGRALPWHVVLAVLAAVSVALVAVSYVTLVLMTHRFFQVGGGGHAYLNVGVEANVPTWWSVTMLTVGATLMLLLAWLLHGERRGGAWVCVAIGVLLLGFSLDELASLHEHLHRVGGLLVSAQTLPYVWLAVGVPLALGIVVVVVLLARRIPRAVRPLLLAGLATFFAGAVGMELVGSQLVATAGEHSTAVVAAYHLEEGLEMVGAALMAVAPLRALRVDRSTPGTVLIVAAR
ncbi:hypothetical protein M3148_08555 [Georgenia satyanarayanai]|uniref:hypothetical protein n=1 Tax=Georgenia satyanarayanai TaxID=860221 RepID=UPI0020423AE7|nr:hypothetical protein [Georgenia satyanarayanai]MCM3661040.1 hypothetical protein [Georgenia satyanarayanai]